MKIKYNMFYKGRFMSRTASLKIALGLKVLGWDFQTVNVYV